MKIKNKMIKYLIIILGLVGGILIASSIILFAFRLDIIGVTLLDEDRTLIGNQETSWTYEKIFECFTFIDGKPFGIRY